MAVPTSSKVMSPYKPLVQPGTPTKSVPSPAKVPKPQISWTIDCIFILTSHRASPGLLSQPWPSTLLSSPLPWQPRPRGKASRPWRWTSQGCPRELLLLLLSARLKRSLNLFHSKSGQSLSPGGMPATTCIKGTSARHTRRAAT